MSKILIDELKRVRSILSAVTGFEDDDQEYVEDARRSVDQIIAAMLAEQPAPVQGWKLVPVKPTKEMVDALCDTDPERDSIWDAVLAASPQAQPAPMQQAQQGRPSFTEWTGDYVQDNLHKLKPAQRTWVGLMRGVRVEGDTVVITVKGGNDAARELCGALLEEKNT